MTGVRHAREGRELVDHAADVADLADDRVGALREDFGIGGDLAGIFALQPLGRKLDRRQRILDLVRDAARDVGPGGGALRRDQIGDVVEGGDEAAAVRAALARHLHAQRARCRAALDGRPRRSARPTGSEIARRMSAASSGTASE